MTLIHKKVNLNKKWNLHVFVNGNNAESTARIRENQSIASQLSWVLFKLFGQFLLLKKVEHQSYFHQSDNIPAAFDKFTSARASISLGN